MKLIFKNQIFKELENRDIAEFEGNNAEELGKKEFANYIKSAYEDYMKYHYQKTSEFYSDEEYHDELCSWCNFHSSILDFVRSPDRELTLEQCRAFCNEGSCKTCLSKTFWYKRIL